MTPLAWLTSYATTGMSHRGHRRACKERGCGLAWRSLVGFSMLGAFQMSCIVAPPPDSDEAIKTPPWLDLAAAVPSVYEVNHRSKIGEGTYLEHLTVGVRSEDAGDRLVALLYENWNSENEEHVRTHYRNPSTFSDTTRSISVPWDYSASDHVGCWQLTLLVTHFLNVDWEGKDPKPILYEDVALASWMFNIGDDPPGTVKLSDCPTNSGGGS